MTLEKKMMFCFGKCFQRVWYSTTIYNELGQQIFTSRPVPSNKNGSLI